MTGPDALHAGPLHPPLLPAGLTRAVRLLRPATARPAGWRATCYSLAARKCKPSQRAQRRHAGTPSPRARTEDPVGPAPGEATTCGRLASAAPRNLMCPHIPPRHVQTRQPHFLLRTCAPAMPTHGPAGAIRPCPRTRMCISPAPPGSSGRNAAATLPQRALPGAAATPVVGNVHPQRSRIRPRPPRHQPGGRTLADSRAARRPMRTCASGAQGVGTLGDGEEREGTGKWRGRGERRRRREGTGREEGRGGKGEGSSGASNSYGNSRARPHVASELRTVPVLGGPGGACSPLSWARRRGPPAPCSQTATPAPRQRPRAKTAGRSP
jgi:hypothetical protein